MMILGLGIGFYLLDFGTDLDFSVDMSQMSSHVSSSNFTEEIRDCRMKTVERLKKLSNEMTCFQTEDRTENFKCLDFLNKLQQEARNCFNREQHFDSENLKQFTYMRIDLISIF